MPADTKNLPWRPDLNYMTGGERAEFKKMREAGAISIYRIGLCVLPGCAEEVPANKQYCSEDHATKEARELQAKRDAEADEIVRKKRAALRAKQNKDQPK